MPSEFGVAVFVAVLAIAGAAEEKLPLIERTHAGLQGILDFLSENYQQINLDCLYGMVLAHGFLENILQMELNQRDLDLITGYKETIEKVISLVKPILQNDGKTKGEFVKGIIDTKKWLRNVSFKENVIDTTFSVRKDLLTNQSFFDFESIADFMEYRSDECLAGIVNSGSHETPHICKLSKWCVKNMIRSNDIRPGYIVTHRLLLQQLARAQNCIMYKKQYESDVRTYCSYVYWELKENKKFGFIRKLDDLLLEQVTLCGAEGFAEFVAEDLLEYILGIQTEQGCFSVDIFVSKKKRQKRTANYIKYGCNDHSTGLGASSLSLFLLSLYQKGDML